MENHHVCVILLLPRSHQGNTKSQNSHSKNTNQRLKCLNNWLRHITIHVRAIVTLPSSWSFRIGSMEVTDEQMVPAPPDFSVSPSPSVLLDRVRKALNTEVPKPVSYAVHQRPVICVSYKKLGFHLESSSRSCCTAISFLKASSTSQRSH